MSKSSLMHSRRGVLKGIAAGSVALLGSSRVRVSVAEEYTADPRVEAIVKSALSIDMKSDCPQPQPAFEGARRRGDRPSPSDRLPLAEQIRRSRLTGVCYSYLVDFPRRKDWKPDDWYEYHLECLSYVDRLLRSNGMRRALDFEDYKHAAHGGVPTIIQGCEGAQWINGKIGRVAEAYDRGLRVCQLLHTLHSTVSPMGDVQDNLPPVFGGLTPFGAKVIKECNRLGILVDLAHGRYSTVLGAIEAAEQPFIVSHTSLFTETGIGMTPAWLQCRLITKEYARAVADSGGVVGLWRIFATLRGYVTALKELVDVVGVDHAGIGTDTAIVAPLGVSYVPRTNSIWFDENGGFLIAVVAEMLKQGFRQDEISKITGGNFFRLFQRTTAGKAAARAA